MPAPGADSFTTIQINLSQSLNSSRPRVAHEQRGAAMSQPQLRPEGLSILRDQLSARSIDIISQISDLHFMTGQQIEAIHFPLSEHMSAAGAARAARRSLELLTNERLLVRLQRRVGGARAGSASYIYGLGPVGHRLLALNRPRPRYREPSATFIDHTLGISQLVIDVSLASKDDAFELLACQSEPFCWRQFSWMGAPATLRPDLYLALGVKEFEHRWFCEIDNGTEHLPAIIRKCRQYEAYYQSGREQAAHGVFPRICWLVRDEKRAESMLRAIASDSRLSDPLFVVALQGDATEVLRGSTS